MKDLRMRVSRTFQGLLSPITSVLIRHVVEAEAHKEEGAM
jgi:hypothetical protein